jgi:geranylgeranyl reductase family protein
MEREVIVVGAGPAGSATAMALARKGHDVLLLDRKTFPRDKVCGDAVPAGAIEKLYALGMEEKIEAADFYKINRIRLVSPKGHIMDADLNDGNRWNANSVIVPRMEFDALLQEHAVDSGAEFRQAHVKEPILENGQVVGVRARLNGTTKEIRSKVVIGADGVTSVVARAIRPDQHVDGHRAVALRAYIEDLEELPHQVEFYLYDQILPGYAWIFPLAEGQANIGLGMRLDTFREGGYNLNEMLDRMLEMPEIKKRVKNGGQLRDVGTWQLNFGSQKNVQRAYAGALLVGDAAGLINPLTGGGISNAISSAWLAAETTHAAFLKGDFSHEAFHPYDEYCRTTFGPTMQRSYLLQRALEHLPFAVDWIVQQAQENSEFAQTFMTKL